jgi:hypothetical protein
MTDSFGLSRYAMTISVLNSGIFCAFNGKTCHAIEVFISWHAMMTSETVITPKTTSKKRKI